MTGFENVFVTNIPIMRHEIDTKGILGPPVTIDKFSEQI